MTTPLSETERATLYNGLRVAAEQYRKDAAVMSRTSHESRSLVDTFNRQASLAEQLADQIENCEEISIEL